MTPLVRFDDLTTGTAVALLGFRGELVAERPAEVRPLLAEVERTTTAGAWAAGFVSYEAATGVNRDLSTLERRASRPLGELPLAWFALFDASREIAPLAAADGPRHYEVSSWVPDTDDATYASRLEAVRAAIRAGETYQCNLTTRLRARAAGDLSELYTDLALAQGGAYCASLDTGRFAVLSASPELFFEWEGNRITARPMKGTAPRGRFPAEDEALARGLVESEKERAENLMIVDLLRNDLGRIAEWGSVEVPSLFSVEKYQTVWQLTSTISATLLPGTGLADVFAALFPCGSVTGAPKRRTMQLIAELEDSPRGVYCGAAGVVAPPGGTFRARFSVPIRTVAVDRLTGDAVYGTGSGITWDSEPAAERAELAVKSRILERPPEELSLIETMAFVPGTGMRNLGLHLARLSYSACRLGFLFDEKAVVDALDEATATLVEPRRLRLTLERSGKVDVEGAPMPPPTRGAVGLAVDAEPVTSSDPLLFYKTTRRTPYEERLARHPEADDVVLVNERGQPTETAIASLLVHLHGRWWTPPVEVGCLPGVERQRLLEDGLVAERALSLEDLRRAERLAVVSSLRGWRAAVLVSSPAAKPPGC